MDSLWGKSRPGAGWRSARDSTTLPTADQLAARDGDPPNAPGVPAPAHHPVGRSAHPDHHFWRIPPPPGRSATPHPFAKSHLAGHSTNRSDWPKLAATASCETPALRTAGLRTVGTSESAARSHCFRPNSVDDPPSIRQPLKHHTVVSLRRFLRYPARLDVAQDQIRRPLIGISVSTAT